MPPLPGFSDNPFHTRDDVVHAAEALIKPLIPYQSPKAARIRIQPSSAAVFDNVAAQLEGFARPLFALSGLLRAGDALQHVDMKAWLRGLEAGVDPASEEYWGDLSDFDQRMVEMESIAVTILSGPEAVLSVLSETSKDNLKTWLLQINEHTMPQNNWRWFRIFVNLALYKVLDVPRSRVQAVMDDDFALLDSFYIDEGWSSDGPWDGMRKQADYYSGSFAIQFAQLLYVNLVGQESERVQRYRAQAQEYAVKYWRYFDVNGAAIPFGRSLTYRFAFAAFWAAAALAEVHLPAPLDSLGAVKGMLLRHLRWWSRQRNIFNSNGTLSIGYANPDMYMSEDYNSPQSVYWCLKSFVVLGLEADHPFWTTKETPHPLAAAPDLSSIEVIWPARQIICSAPEHHFLLSSGQSTGNHHKAREAKYGKFAYSSAFALSVPTGHFLEQVAPDSTLCATFDGGSSWKVREAPEDVRLEQVLVGKEGRTVPALTSVWKPWKFLDLEIETTLVPLGEHHPGWHIRIHRLGIGDGAVLSAVADEIELVDGGFAIPSVTDGGLHLPPLSETDTASTHGWFESASRSFLRSSQGAGGVHDLTSAFEASRQPLTTPGQGLKLESTCNIIRADANTNIMYSKTNIPAAKHVVSVARDGGQQVSGREVWFATGVFCVSLGDAGAACNVPSLWGKVPVVEMVSGLESRFRVL